MNHNVIHNHVIYSYPWQLVLSLFIIISKLYMLYSLKIDVSLYSYIALYVLIIHYLNQFMLLIAYTLSHWSHPCLHTQSMEVAYTKYGSR